MKFETYLEAIKLDVINELLNVNVKDKSMVKINNTIGSDFLKLLSLILQYAKKYNLSSDELLLKITEDSITNFFKNKIRFFIIFLSIFIKN